MSGETPAQARDREESTAKDWLWRAGQTLYQAVKDFFNDSGTQWAAAVAYYSLLSLFPLLLAVASISAYFIDPQWVIDEATRLMGAFLPQGTGQIESIVQGAVEARGTASLLSLLGLLWTGSRVFGAITRALNIAYDVDESYQFVKRTAVEMVMLATVGAIFLIALVAPLAINVVSRYIQLPGQGLLYRLAYDGLPILLLLLAFFLAYRFVPRRRIRWQAALAGAALATLLLVVARPILVYYLERFARYNLIYGSLAIAVILVVWAWIAAQILILGGEVASHTQAILIEGQSPGDLERRHRERSPVRQVLPDELVPGDEAKREGFEPLEQERPAVSDVAGEGEGGSGD